LEQLVKRVAIGAAIAVIDLVVRAHDGAHTGTDPIDKGPEIQLVHGLVIQVGADTLIDVIAIALRLARLAEMLLLVENVMLGASNDTSILNTLDGFREQLTGQDG